MRARTGTRAFFSRLLVVWIRYFRPEHRIPEKKRESIMCLTQGARETSNTYVFHWDFLRLALAKLSSGWQSGDSIHPPTCTCFQCLRNREEVFRTAKIVQPKSSRPATWRNGAWNFLVERFLLNTRFSAASYETAEENKKLNKDIYIYIVRPQTSR